MSEDLIPIVMFIMIGLSVIGVAYFRFRARQEQQLTLRELLASSHDASPETLATLMEGLTPAPGADLRRGVISITLGVAVLVFGVVLGQEDAQRPLMALSAFPFLVGLAYVILWWTKREDA